MIYIKYYHILLLYNLIIYLNKNINTYKTISIGHTLLIKTWKKFKIKLVTNRSQHNFQDSHYLKLLRMVLKKGYLYLDKLIELE